MIQQYEKERLNSISRKNFIRHTCIYAAGLKPVFPSPLSHRSCPWKQTEVVERLSPLSKHTHICLPFIIAVRSLKTCVDLFSLRTYNDWQNALRQQNLTPGQSSSLLRAQVSVGGGGKNRKYTSSLQYKWNKGFLALISEANKTFQAAIAAVCLHPALAEAAAQAPGAQIATVRICRMHNSRICPYFPVPSSRYTQVWYLKLKHEQLGISRRHSCHHPGGIMIYCNFEIIQQLFSHFRIQTTTLISLQISY